MSPASAFTWYRPVLLIDEHRFLVHSHDDNMIVFNYEYRSAANKPFVSTLCGPSGRNLVENSPAEHLHHHGIWWGHGDVNGIDYYLELPHELPRGAIEHLMFISVIDEPAEGDSRSARFGFVERLAWRDPTGAVVIDEQRSLLLAFRDGDHYTVDLDSSYTARTDLTFGDTKESVLPGIRLAENMTGDVGGTITSSEGLTGEQATFGQPARWIDVSAPRRVIFLREEIVEGITCFDHPSNPSHPTRWFTREYGPISPFEGHHFYEDRHLAAGASLRLRHRLVVHRGTAADADLETKYATYLQEVRA
jgi:hypothetical protein